MKRCLSITPEIKKLAAGIEGETVGSVKALIELWQDIYNVDWDTYPSHENLIQFRDAIRGEKKESPVNTIPDINLDFTPIVRRNRVNLIARMFSVEINRAMEDLQNMLNKTADSGYTNRIDPLDRMRVISLFTPKELFRRVLNRNFIDWVSLTEQEKIEDELAAINSKKGAEKYSEEVKKNAAMDRVKYKNSEYSKVINNFNKLAKEATSILKLTEGIAITPSFLSTADEIYQEILPDEKENWMTEYKETSSYVSLSRKVRKALMQMPRLDSRGKVERDDLGNILYIDPEYAHAALMDGLRNMVSIEDMIPTLTEMASRKPWAKQIIKMAENDESLKSQMYQDFRKDFTPYWIQKTSIQSDGTLKTNTIEVNKPESTYYLINKWQDNIEGGVQLSSKNIYNSKSELSSDNAKEGLELSSTIANKIANLDTQGKLNKLNEGLMQDVSELLFMIGIDANLSTLSSALANIKTIEKGVVQEPIDTLIGTINTILSGVSKDPSGNLINTYSGSYGTIASMLNEVTEDAIESSTHENGKTYYSHILPNYLGKMIKSFKGSKFQEYINSEYRPFNWFWHNNRWLNGWVKDLEESPAMRKLLSHKVVLYANNKSYGDWTTLEYTNVLLNEYFSSPKGDSAWYYVPVLSDTDSSEFIRFKRFSGDNYKEELLHRMIDTVIQEVNRIDLVTKRDKLIQEGKVLPIANFDIVRDKKGSIIGSNGAEFKFFPKLNENGFLDRLREVKKNQSSSDVIEFIKSSIEEIMEEGFESAYREWNDMGLLEELPNGKYKYLASIGVKTGQSQRTSYTINALQRSKESLGERWTEEMESLLNDYINNSVSDRKANEVFNSIISLLESSMGRYSSNITRWLNTSNNAKEALREYYWNSSYATSQIIQLTTTDLAYYKNMEDFQKRFKEVHSPTNRLNTSSKYGRQTERTVYLKDDVVIAPSYEEIKSVFDNAVTQGKMDKEVAMEILKAYKKVNVTDAQAYRSLSSYRSVLDMTGRWTEEMEEAYNNITNNRFSSKDITSIWQPLKPFLYTQVSQRDGVNGNMRIPVQNKNSEFPLLAIYNIAGVLGSPKLKAINQFMEEYDIDMVQFESAVKVGKQGIIDLSGKDGFEDVYSTLVEYSGIKTGGNPEIVHTISYEDYGIQNEVPEHAIDALQSLGTQLRKLIVADMPDDITVSIGKKSFDKKGLVSLYNNLITENILDSYEEMRELFSSDVKLSQVLTEQLYADGRYDNSLKEAVSIENDTFSIPLSDPVMTGGLHQVLSGIIRSHITKQKVKGGSVVQVSSYGLSDDLKIVFDGDRIKYMECYMPAYSRKFYEPLMDSEGKIDINKLPTNLRKFIGYRIPTEDKYSMLPLYIKGFLPVNNGASIMLPKEITTITGSDFDIDKLYIFLPEFYIQKKDIIDRNRFINDLVTQQSIGKSYTLEEMQAMRTLINESIEKGENNEEGTNEYNIWRTYEDSKKNYRINTITTFHKVQYDFSLPASEQSKAARNNALLDIMFSILTNPITTTSMLNPQGFTEQKRMAMLVSIFKNTPKNTLIRLYGDDFINKVRNLSTKELSALYEAIKPVLNPISPMTQLRIHRQNMTGANLIGGYATQNANHALLQFTEIGLNDNGAFTLNGKSHTSLHSITGDSGTISRSLAGFLGASVDNAKDPILGLLNQSMNTLPITTLLLRLGYTIEEVSVFISQPILVDINNTIESSRGTPTNVIISKIVNQYAKKAGIFPNTDYSAYKGNSLTLDELYGNLVNRGTGTFYKSQVAVGVLFNKMLESANAIGDIIKVLRADTPQGGLGSSFGETINKVEALRDLLKSSSRISYPLSNSNVVNWLNVADSKTNLREALLNSKLPYMQAFYSLGIHGGANLLSKYFPQYSKSFIETIYGTPEVEGIASYTKSGKLDDKTMNKVFNSLYIYIMSDLDFFKAGTTIEEARKEYLTEFPDKFREIVSRNSAIAELDFIKALRIINTDKGVDIVFRNAGKLTPNLRDRYMQDWESLLSMEDETAVNLALDLFRYGYYKYGFSFNPKGYMHLAPNGLRKAIPGYIDKINEIVSLEDDYTPFIRQFLMNNLDNRKFCPVITLGESIKENGGNIEVSFSESPEEEVMRIVKSTTYELGMAVHTPFDFISINSKEGKAYYTLSNFDGITAVYVPVEPLNGNQYDYNKELSVPIISSLTENREPVESADNTEVEDIYEREDIDMSIISTVGTTLEEHIREVNKAFKEVLGENIGEREDNNILTISPLENQKDADGKPIC